MTRHLHEPANALLYRALDLPTEERQQFIADACAGEPDLLELVRTLLARIEALDEFLESPLELPAIPAPAPVVAPISADVADARPAMQAAEQEAVPLVVRRRFPLGAAFACLLLAAGIGAALWHAREADHARAVAEQRFEQSRKLAHAMLFELNDALDRSPAAAREQLASAALAYLGPLAADTRLSPELRREVAGAYERLGAITAKPEYLQVARRLRAADAAKPAVQPARAAVAQPVAGISSESLKQLTDRRDSAASLYTRGQSDAGQLQQALQQFTQLQRDLDSLARKHPDNAAARKLAISVLTQLVDLRRLSGDLAGAQQAAQQSLALAGQQVMASPDNAGWRELSAAQRAVGDILVEQGQAGEGLVELRKALATREEIASRSAGNAQAARDVADAHWAIADAMMATMDYDSAEPEFTLARGMYAVQAQASAGDAGLRAGLIELEIARANVQNLQRHGRSAVQSLAALHKLVDKGGNDANLAARVALLDAQIQPRGTPAQAFAQAEQAVPELIKHSEKDPLDIYQLRESALVWQKAGEIGMRANRTEPACRYLGLAAKRYEEFEASKRLNAIDRLRQGQLQALRKPCG
jgi:hypothetical protein